jgi:hypothetical protein
MKNNKSKEIPKDLDMKLVEKGLQAHLKVLLKELEENGGVPPKHRIEEERRLGLI